MKPNGCVVSFPPGKKGKPDLGSSILERLGQWESGWAFRV